MQKNHTHSSNSQSFSRRAVIKAMGLGAATTAFTSLALGSDRSAQSQVERNQTVQNSTGQFNSTQASPVITKSIPRTNEVVPVIGMGTFLTFDVLSDQPRNHLQEVMSQFWQGGGRMIDVSPLYGMSEINVGELAAALNITDDLFIANKIWATGDYLGDDSHALRQLEQSMQRLSRDRIEAMQVHSLVNVEMLIPLLREWKQDGRIRYLGVTHHDLPLYAAPIAQWIENGELDFVQVRYSIFERGVEERILPAAADQGTAVLVNMPFEKARLFEVVQGQPLPDFASEIGCENWAQFFLKYVISHPAVTCAIPATTNPVHVAENLGAMREPLPDQEMRTRMVQHMESLPGFGNLAQMPWYPGKQFSGLVRLPGLAATQNARGN
ncbi:aldo/keto reductase [Nodosilinea sp. LEGE 07088]|uniref:aldo/keto reductase n=1 Tax=Nodosilinea sp. LEGE 07088 TaxID=2777968 RepID=UPI00187E2881|nr:aldo/keto reductase [Nodosilinea sp. LEGE 07088]MBE9138246.1 aldo/keto reductase [Nodosilinea sp. LEGE 07088]